MFNAFPEPCSSSGISTNVKRALTAAVLASRIPLLAASSHRLFNPTPSVAELIPGYSLPSLSGLAPYLLTTPLGGREARRPDRH
jgi:hypothetical protein